MNVVLESVLYASEDGFQLGFLIIFDQQYTFANKSYDVESYDMPQQMERIVVFSEYDDVVTEYVV